MYAVVTTGGKQYRVEAGSELLVERLPGEAGSSVTFDRVLLVGDGESVTVGTPTVAGASVSGTVVGEALGPKLIIFKFKQKVKYRRRTGHRQHLTRVRIDEISASGKTSTVQKAATDKAAAKAAPADAVEKPKRAARKPAARKVDAGATPSEEKDAAPAAAVKPKRTRKPAAKKAEAEE
jgi:large subunit ribosomal protein L21